MKLKASSILGLGMISGFTTLIAFLMIQVFFADIIKGIVEGMHANSSDITAFWITLLGFLLAMGVGGGVSQLAASNLERPPDTVYIYYASLLALIANLIAWSAIAYVVILPTYDLGVIQGILAYPRVLTFGMVELFGNIPTFWMFAALTHVAFFSVFLIALGARTKLRSVKLEKLRR